jgi:hypothetical protein
MPIPKRQKTADDRKIIESFSKLVAIKQRGGMNRRRAVAACAREYSELHQMFIDASQP